MIIQHNWTVFMDYVYSCILCIARWTKCRRSRDIFYTIARHPAWYLTFPAIMDALFAIAMIQTEVALSISSTSHTSARTGSIAPSMVDPALRPDGVYITPWYMMQCSTHISSRLVPRYYVTSDDDNNPSGCFILVCIIAIFLSGGYSTSLTLQGCVLRIETVLQDR